jgi:hypothetical protein
VVFYLIGQALCAPKGGVLVLDEPELHIHRSIQTKLWDEIEAARPDCLFVYLTHELEFAASRLGATKIWLREFDGKNWAWELVPENGLLPEPLLLRVLGSRKNVLFVEGTSGALDEEVYTHLYPQWSVTPCGSCEHVIHATGVYSNMASFHRLQCRGLIDADERTPSEISALSSAGIHVLGFTELENIFLLEGALRIAAEGLLPGERPDDVLARVRERVLNALAADRERVISRRVAGRLQELTRHFHTKALGDTAIAADWDRLYQSANPVSDHGTEAKRIDTILANRDYTAAIRIFPNKGLLQQVTALFGSTNLQRYFRKLLAAPNGEPLRAALRNHVPTIG